MIAFQRYERGLAQKPCPGDCGKWLNPKVRNVPIFAPRRLVALPLRMKLFTDALWLETVFPQKQRLQNTDYGFHQGIIRKR